jgi:hypothetical protein
MGDFQISVVNKTGSSNVPGKHVNVMLFQTEPDPLIAESYSTAWKVDDIQFPGTLGPITLPEKVQFAVLDTTPDGDPRTTGPVEVEFGQIINVTQKKSADAPKISVSGEQQPNKEIKVTNLSGNVKKMEMALFKNGRKLVSFKDVIPGNAVYLNVKPVIYIANIDGIVQGSDFLAANQAAKSTEFALQADVPSVTIQITQLPSGQINFSLLH